MRVVRYCGPNSLTATVLLPHGFHEMHTHTHSGSANDRIHIRTASQPSTMTQTQQMAGELKSLRKAKVQNAKMEINLFVFGSSKCHQCVVGNLLVAQRSHRCRTSSLTAYPFVLYFAWVVSQCNAKTIEIRCDFRIKFCIHVGLGLALGILCVRLGNCIFANRYICMHAYVGYSD